MAELRPYQQQLLEQAEAALQPQDARVMLQLPTGGGKTHIAGALLRRWLRGGRKAVWLTHRTELADQTCGMLSNAGVSAIALKTWQSGNDAPAIPSGVVILMAQTVGRRTNRMQIWGKYGTQDLLVIDEAHHATADGYERAIKQWPGRIIGLTATPWRLSEKEGFDHLFKKLLPGPQVNKLQADNWLCQANVLMPKPEDVIRGGSIADTGDYSEPGIEMANQDRPDVMTAGALRFWQFHAAERQTIVYAVSKDHAHNLMKIFEDAGIPAAVILSETLAQERAKAIKSFGNRTLRVLVNVAVATEGFDLPDASCVVITRPTLSLALYLQMVGRGLRPKANGGNCLILDLAGNAEIHGLPGDERTWSLEPRGDNPSGDAPVVQCEKCDGVSPAASHNCVNCGANFGKECSRCGRWRASERWSYETHCGEQHELVCDLCHYDAHIQAQLPVTDELRRLNTEADLEATLRNLLEEECRRVGGADEERKKELRSLILNRESELADEDSLDKAFKQHLSTLPLEEQPRKNWPQMVQLYSNWKDTLIQELGGWKAELDKLDAKVPDRLLIYSNARERLLQVLEAVALEAKPVPQARPARRSRENEISQVNEPLNPVPVDMSGWMSFTQLSERGKTNPKEISSGKPQCIRDLHGIEMPVENWSDVLFKIADWLVKNGGLTDDKCPIVVGNMGKRYLIHSKPLHPDGRGFQWKRLLSNGMYLEGKWDPRANVRRSEQLLDKLGQDPAQFHVQLR